MDDRGSLPWPSFILCAATMFVLVAAKTDTLLVLATALVWIGSIWILTLRPPPPQSKSDSDPFSRERLGELIEYSGTPVLLIDHSRVSIANEAARKLLGSHVVGQDMRVAFRHPEAVRLLDKKRGGFAQIRGLVRRRDVWRINKQLLGKDLAVIELQNQTAEVDIARAHTDFVANASHELRTPLASIIGYVETLQDGDERVDSDLKRKFLDTILAEANRLRSLVSDLMSLSRIEAEKHEQPQNRIDLSAIVESSSKDVAGLDREGRLAFHIEPNLCIQGDKRQIEQLVRNLVDNALKYGDPNTEVTVTLRQNANDEATLQVRDRGEGISPDHIPHLTRRFYRTDPGRSRASGGTGLGLAIVKHIVERHRGRLDISSELGQGTLVTARIPLIEDKPTRDKGR